MQKVKPRNKKDYTVIIKSQLLFLKRKLPVILMMVSLGYFLIWFSNTTIIKPAVHIQNTSAHINTQLLLANLQPFIKNPLNISAIREHIATHSWVKDIHIKRIWNTLHIEIIPKTVLFNWQDIQDAHNAGLIDNDLQLFFPKTTHTNTFATIISSADQSEEASAHLIQYQKILPTTITKLIKTTIETLVLPNGAKIILGQQDQAKRLQKLATHYHKFKMRPSSIVDLRYNNGFAKTN
jgi:cell division septal protein FtsQ